MTIPLIRKRAKKPKARTGCRTCRARHVKCDEAKPICLRCSKSGRECGGYDQTSQSAPRDPVCTLILPKVKQSLDHISVVSRPLSSITISLNSEEGYTLNFFKQKSLVQLPGNSWRLSWDRLVMQMCGHEPAVTHAAIAVGFLHRAQNLPSNDPDAVILHDSSAYLHAIDSCNKAMSYLRARIEALSSDYTDDDVEVILLVSLLFFCFEIIHGEDSRAVLHFKTGIRILYERIGDRKALDQDGKRVVEMKVAPKSNLDILTHTFVRLDYDFIVSTEVEHYLHPVLNSPMPRSFSSLEEAMVHLDAEHVKVDALGQRCTKYARSKLTVKDYAMFPPGWSEEWATTLALGRFRSDDLKDRPDIVDDIENSQRSLRAWMSALAFVPLDPDRELQHLLLQLQFFHIWIEIEIAHDLDVMAVDRFGDQFEHTMNLLERYAMLQGLLLESASPFAPDEGPDPGLLHCMSTPNSQIAQKARPDSASTTPFTSASRSSSATGNSFSRFTPPAFCLGTGLVACLATVAMCCRSTSVRRRCLALVRAINMSGIFDSAWLAAFIECIISIEERRARILLGRDPDCDTRDLCPNEIPACARVLEVDLEGWQNIKDWSPEFYKEDTGRLVYSYVDHDGQVKIAAATFFVRRDRSNPSSRGSRFSSSPSSSIDDGFLSIEEVREGIVDDLDGTDNYCRWTPSIIA